MARRNDHSRDQIRKMALTAAAEIVAEQGPSALTARKVAAAIGYTVGTLYLVFENLDDLILQLNATTLTELEAQMRAAAARSRMPAAQVRALAHTYHRFAADNLSRWTLVFEHRLPPDYPLPDFYAQRIGALFGLVEQALAALLGQPPGRETARAARALWAGVHGICILGLTDKLNVGGEAGVEDVADTLIENYLRGMSRV